MHLHTDRLDSGDLYEAARIACVGFVFLEEKRSRTRTRRFDFRLEGWASNRRPNWGTGARDTHDGYAATWDEWGIFLNVLFVRDAEAHTGNYGYLGLEHFQYATGNRFDTLARAGQHINHNWRSGPMDARLCGCGAVVRYDRPEHLRLVKHGIVNPSDPASIERWLVSA